MRRKMLAVVLAGGFALTGCSDDDGGGDAATDTTKAASDTTADPRVGDVPPCEDLYAQGAIVTLEQVEQGCLREDGEHYLAGVETIDCTDERVLMWNDHAWWYEGEGVNPHDSGAEELVAPAEERESCEAS
jgi:hypothetical protein